MNPFVIIGGPKGERAERPSKIRKFLFDEAVPFDGQECLLWPFGRNARGYGAAKIDGRSSNAHRFVCEIVHGAPPGDDYEAAHNCGNRLCVNPVHLRWATSAENNADKLTHGTLARGEKNGRAKLTVDDVKAIRRLRKTTTIPQLASTFGVGRATISSVFSGKAWGWVE